MFQTWLFSIVYVTGSKINVLGTGTSFSEALILASTNPQYDRRLFIELPVQYMKTTSSEHKLFWMSKQKYNLCTQ